MTLAELWRYYPPTTEKAPKYEAIRSLTQDVINIIFRIKTVADHGVTYDDARSVTLALAETILRTVPECGDRERAISACRLTRMALNEAIKARSMDIAQDIFELGQAAPLESTHYVYRRLMQAENAVIEARWWACSAIALEGVDR